MTEQQKKVHITGTNNKYQMNKLLKNNTNKEAKKRVVSEKWTFSEEFLTHSYQLQTLESISKNDFKQTDEITKVVIQEINKKIYGYKQQDIIKKHYDANNFLTFNNVISRLNDSKLKCHYCSCEMSVLYDFSREMKQWSVDRIDNDKGHNNDNFHLACLDCNLKRRRRTDEKFLFTKQLNIVKQNENEYKNKDKDKDKDKDVS